MMALTLWVIKVSSVMPWDRSVRPVERDGTGSGRTFCKRSSRHIRRVLAEYMILNG